jgi:hypothetical protein
MRVSLSGTSANVLLLLKPRRREIFSFLLSRVGPFAHSDTCARLCFREREVFHEFIVAFLLWIAIRSCDEVCAAEFFLFLGGKTSNSLPKVYCVSPLDREQRSVLAIYIIDSPTGCTPQGGEKCVSMCAVMCSLFCL